MFTGAYPGLDDTSPYFVILQYHLWYCPSIFG